MIIVYYGNKTGSITQATIKILNVFEWCHVKHWEQLMWTLSGKLSMYINELYGIFDQLKVVAIM